MLNFILEILIIISLGTLLYLLARTLPRINDNETEITKLKSHWINAYLEKTDEWLKARFEKFLRRLKIWILKVDNWVSNKLNKFKKPESRETMVPLKDEDSEKNQNSV